jgi:hypothetical protein
VYQNCDRAKDGALRESSECNKLEIFNPILPHRADNKRNR